MNRSKNLKIQLTTFFAAILLSGCMGSATVNITTSSGTSQDSTASSGSPSNPVYSNAVRVSTFAGVPPSAGYRDGTGASARFNMPSGVAVDPSGNVYVADFSNHVIRKITASGVVTTLAGSAGNYGYQDGTGTGAKFCEPIGVNVDPSSGRVYVADRCNHAIRMITPSGEVSTLAGSAGNAGYQNGTGAAALFQNPSGVSVDPSSGTVYVADLDNHAIRKITSGGVVTTLAGGGPQSGGFADGTGTFARFYFPTDVAFDPSSGHVYVSDGYNRAIRKITASGVVTTLAGGSYGSADGSGTAAQFKYPGGVAVDPSGSVYVADWGAIRKITSAGEVSTLGVSANPRGLAVVQAGSDHPGQVNIYVADGSTNLISNISFSVITSSVVDVTTLAGNSAGNSGFTDTSEGISALFNTPQGVAVDQAGNVYVADTNNNAIRKITSDGIVTTLAGGGPDMGGFADGTGSGARFDGIIGVAVDHAGNVYVADSGNQAIRKITSSGIVTTLAGGGPVMIGFADGTGSGAKFSKPTGVAVDQAGNVYVADFGNNAIRKITSSGVVTTLAGGGADNAGSAGSTDTSEGQLPLFNSPSGVAVDQAGNVYVADQGNNAIRKITASGVVTTLAGIAGSSGATDGTGTDARFNTLNAVAVDQAGNVYVTDYNGEEGIQNAIRKITPSGVVTTLAGQVGGVGFSDGTGTAANFNYPSGLAVDQSGKLYVADTNNNLIRKIE